MGLEKLDFVISEQRINENKTELDLKPILFEIDEAMTNTIIRDKEKMAEMNKALLELKEKKQGGIKITYPEVVEDAPVLKNSNTILLDFLELGIGIGNNLQKITMTLNNKIAGFVNEQLDELVISMNNSSEYFGPGVILNKKVLILWPILIVDANGENQLASVSIEFYEYGMAILKISYPIENQTSYPLMLNTPDLYHKNCYYNVNTNNKTPIEDFDYKKVPNNSIDSVIDIILGWLEKKSEGFIRSESREIIQLNKLKPKNINMRQAKKEEKEAIFRIVNAPVLDGIKLHPERNIVWDEQGWGNEQMRYFFSTMGKCVVVAGHSAGSSLPEDTPEEEVNAIIKRSLLMDVEDAYKVMLLNRLNSVNFLLKQDKDDYHDLKLLKEDYYFSENYILGLLDYSFGTVRDLYSTIEDVTNEYLNKKSLEKRFKNNQTVLSNRHQEKVRKENDRLSILGLLITVLVSFPAIYETLSIFQSELVTTNIPGISVLGLSIFFEFLLLWSLFRWYRNKK